MSFDALNTCNKMIEYVRDYYSKHKLKGAVIGISGGKDSGVVAGLMTKALGKENVVGLKMPCHSLKDDSTLADLVAKHYGFKLYNVDLTKTFDDFEAEIAKSFGKVSSNDLTNSSINLKPRLRMSALYYYAALLTSIKHEPYIVIGTGNKCEMYVGYFTKGGDGVSDMSPLADLTVEEVIKIGEVLGVPSEVLYRTPSDGLSGQSDEEKMGIKYSDISKYILDPSLVDKDVALKIKTMHDSSRHKFNSNFYLKD